MTRSVDELTTNPSYRAGVIDLLGVLAVGELLAFQRLASDAALAPGTREAAALSGMAASEYGHFVQLSERLESLGVDPHDAMEPFAVALEEYHRMTAPSDWLEGIVKAYVGDGVATDFFREVARYVDPETAALVMEVCSDFGRAEFAVEAVRSAVEADPRLAGRLALWGRRLVGEAVSQAQHVAATREPLIALLLGEDSDAVPNLAEIAGLLNRITSAHGARMGRLGLAG